MKKFFNTANLVLCLPLIIGLSGCSIFSHDSASSEKMYKDGNVGIGDKGYFQSGMAYESNSPIENLTKKSEAHDSSTKLTKSSFWSRFGKTKVEHIDSGDSSKIKAAGEYQKVSIAYPTGRAATSVLNIEKSFPKVVQLGKDYDYQIKVTNLSDLNLSNVNISEIIPNGFQIASSNPAITNRLGDKANWNLGNMAPGSSSLITLKGTATSKKNLPCCTSANYDNPSLCNSMDVVEPALSLEVSAPAEKTICDSIPVEFTVKNTGDSNLNDVSLNSNLPQGTSSNGSNSINIKVGNLAPNEVKKISSMVKADKTGSYSFNGSATSEDASANSNTARTRVTKPALSVSASANKEMVYAGRPISYNVTVKNTGDTNAESTMLEARIPSNTKFKSASNGGQSSGSSVKWNLGTLKPYGSSNVSFEVISTDSGSAETEAKATASCCQAAAQTALAQVKGIPALLLEVVDVADPIEVGGTQTYIISVTNQGTADARNIKIVANLEDDMNYVSDAGQTSGSSSGNTVSFSPLATLGAKQVAKWTIKATGDKADDVRFKVSLTSDDLTRPVEETESTHVY